MKKVLIPIDYSYDALDGLDYVIKLAAHLKLKLVLFHVNPLKKGASQIETSKKEDSSTQVLSLLAREKTGNLSYPLSYKIKVRSGEIIDSIIAETESGKYDLVIMGTRDNYTLLDKWIGTVSLGVSRKCKIPLFLIPNGSKFRFYKKILVASDYHINRKGVLDFIAAWNFPFKSMIKFLHVRSSETDSFHKESSMIIHKYYQTREVDFPFEIEIKQGMDIPAIIYQTAIQENMDLIVMTTENKSGLYSLLLKSVSQEVIIRSVKPILLLQPNGKKITA